jgi:hypothetical protein
MGLEIRDLIELGIGVVFIIIIIIIVIIIDGLV